MRAERRESATYSWRRDDLCVYVKSIREAAESRVQLTEAGVIEMRRRVLGREFLRFSRDRIR